MKVGPEKMCLNDLFEEGPDLMQSLLGMQIKSRLSHTLMALDLAKAYLSVSVRPEERDVCRILLLEDPSRASLKDNVGVYRFTVVAFGIVCSSFLLHLVLFHHLRTRCPKEVSDCVGKNFYADNFLLNIHLPHQTSSPLASDIAALHKAVSESFDEVGFRMREVCSNDLSFMGTLPADVRHPAFDGDKTVGMLGFRWALVDDVYHTQVPSPATRKLFDRLSAEKGFTKRLVAAFLAKVGWDLMGLAVPATVAGRLLVQELWVEKFAWDELLTDAYQEKAHNVLATLFHIHQVRWPRRLLLNPAKEVHLVLCCDASESALAASLFLWQTEGGVISSQLVAAKSKNAYKAKDAKKPRRSVPELELCSFVLGVRLALSVKEHLTPNVQVSSLSLMGDSEIALWQCINKRRLTPFCQRRVDEISEAGVDSFHHLKSEDNPADLGTRPGSVEDMETALWRHGPPCVRNSPPSAWPIFAEPSPERRPDFRSALELSLIAVEEGALQEAVSDASGPFGIDAADYSDVHRLIAVTAWAQRAADTFRGKVRPRHPFITASERIGALNTWLRFEQNLNFSETIASLGRDKPDKLARSLDLFVDLHGVVRLGGRLTLSVLSVEAKHPALIAPGRAFTKLLILASHHAVGHGHHKPCLNHLRRSFWLVRGVVECRRVLRDHCALCRLVKEPPLKAPKMGPLPSERVTPCRVWEVIGLDHAGPLTVRLRLPDGEVLKPTHILIITCLWSRNVSLQPVWGTDHEETLQALQRHFLTKGRPRVCWSDNAAGLKKSAAHLTQAPPTAGADAFIDWKFTAPRCAWSGGAWEIVVKQVKKVLKMGLWRRTVSFSLFTTFLAQAEGVCNTRPLCPVTGSPLEPGLEVLTPASLSSPDAQLEAPLFASDAADPDWLPPSDTKALNAAFRKGQRLLHQAKQVFLTSYLVELRLAHRTHFRAVSGSKDWVPRKGAVYLIQEDSKDRQRWERCRVLELLRGVDGLVRYVKVLLPSKTISFRATKQLVPLEADLDESSETLPQAAIDHAIKSHTTSEDAWDDPSQDQAITSTKIAPATTTHPYRTRSSSRSVHFASNLAMFCLLLFALLARQVAGSPVKVGTPPPPTQQSHLFSDKAETDRTHKVPSGLPSEQTSLPPGYPDTGYVCPASGGGTAYSLKGLLTAACTLPVTAAPHALNATIFTPNHRVPTAEGLICFAQETEACTYTALLGTKGIASLPLETRSPVTASECRVANETSLWNGHALLPHPTARNLRLTKIPLTLEYSWLQHCCSKVVNLILERVEVASRDGKELHTSGSLDVTACQATSGTCDVGGATLVWPPYFWAGHCEWTSLGYFPVQVTHGELVIEALERGVTIVEPLLDSCVGQLAYATDMGLVVAFDQAPPNDALPPHLSAGPGKAARNREQGSPSARLHQSASAERPAGQLAGTAQRRARLHQSILRQVDMVGSRINFQAQREEAQAFRGRRERLCLQERHFNTLAYLAIVAHPAKAAQALSGREDVTASLDGDLLIVRGCHALPIRRVHEDHQTGSTCWAFTPVTAGPAGQERLLFLAGAGGELVEHSPVIRCQDRPSRPRGKAPRPLHEIKTFADFSELKRQHNLPFLHHPAATAELEMPRAAAGDWLRRMPVTVTQLNAVIDYASGLHGSSSFAGPALRALGHSAIVAVNGTLHLAEHLGSASVQGVESIADGLLSPFEATIQRVGAYFGYALFGLALVGLGVGLWKIGFYRALRRLFQGRPAGGQGHPGPAGQAGPPAAGALRLLAGPAALPRHQQTSFASPALYPAATGARPFVHKKSRKLKKIQRRLADRGSPSELQAALGSAEFFHPPR